MEIIVNFGGCSDCDALNSRLTKKTLSCEASGHFLKCRLKDGRGGWEEAFDRTMSHKSDFQYFSAAANFSGKLFGALDLQFFRVETF